MVDVTVKIVVVYRSGVTFEIEFVKVMAVYGGGDDYDGGGWW